MSVPSSSTTGTSTRTRTLRSVGVGAAMATALAVLGAAGYHYFEGWSWSDSFYMVFITLSTVGFSEVHPLDAIGRLWTILLVLLGVTLVGYTATRVAELVTEGSLHGYRRQRRMQKEISQLQGHFIVCGFGRVGQQVVRDFQAAGQAIVVIDRDDSAERLSGAGLLYVVGNAEDEETLRSAGIDRARGLVAAVDSDTENVFITLTAKQMNPRLRVIARASEEPTGRKLELVGAERVVSPYVASGRRMAHLALRPRAVDFFDRLSDPFSGLQVEVHEVEIEEGSPFAGRSLKEIDLRRTSGVVVVALRIGGQIELNPDPDRILEVGSALLAIGTPEQCSKLEQMGRARES